MAEFTLDRYDLNLIATLAQAERRGERPRPAKTVVRDRLQRLGLIETRKPHSMANSHRPYWALTAEGRRFAS